SCPQEYRREPAVAGCVALRRGRKSDSRQSAGSGPTREALRTPRLSLSNPKLSSWDAAASPLRFQPFLIPARTLHVRRLAGDGRRPPRRGTTDVPAGLAQMADPDQRDDRATSL